MISILDSAKSIASKDWDKQRFDHLSFAVIDFNNHKHLSFNVINKKVTDNTIYFDLASLTKPLTLSAYFHHNPKKLCHDHELLLNHRAGLKAWAVLGRSSWKDQVNSYAIKESETLYSDLSALRLMLEIEKEEKKAFKDLCSFYWHEQMMFWKDMALDALTPVNGTRHGHHIIGEVNDDNCFRLNQFCSHAGLFATIEGLAQSLLSLNQLTDFVEIMNRDHQHRFDHGWDTVKDESTLAGRGARLRTFGHLGFTGTSLWIDPESKMGWALLTNVTKDYWYERKELNELRRELGANVWSSI